MILYFNFVIERFRFQSSYPMATAKLTEEMSKDMQMKKDKHIETEELAEN